MGITENSEKNSADSSLEDLLDKPFPVEFDFLNVSKSVFWFIFELLNQSFSTSKFIFGMRDGQKILKRIPEIFLSKTSATSIKFRSKTYSGIFLNGWLKCCVGWHFNTF